MERVRGIPDILHRAGLLYCQSSSDASLVHAPVRHFCESYNLRSFDALRQQCKSQDEANRPRDIVGDQNVKRVGAGIYLSAKHRLEEPDELKWQPFQFPDHPSGSHLPVILGPGSAAKLHCMDSTQGCGVSLRA